jgi:glycosyltransferase involved in cell wall biosynthesis
VLIGDGEMRAELKSLARNLGIEQRVMFCGWILDRAVVFSDLDVTCLSSFNEGLPVCLIESLAAGVPVVATDVGGVADLVASETDGVLVRSNDQDAFAKAMMRLARERRRVGPERSASIRECHSTARMVTSLESIYEGLLGRGYTAHEPAIENSHVDSPPVLNGGEGQVDSGQSGGGILVGDPRGSDWLAAVKNEESTGDNPD